MPELTTAEKLVQALNVLEPATAFLEGPAPESRDRGAAEAFLANAPSLFGHQLGFEKLLMALDVAASAIAADPTFGAGYAYAASALYRIGFEDTDIYAEDTLATAQPWAQRGTDVDPLSREAWEVQAEIACFSGDFAAAEKILGEIFTRWGDGDVYARAAFLFFRLQGDAEQAMNWGALAWQQEWNTDRLIQTLFALGQLYRDNSRWRQAADTYRVLCEHDHASMWGHHFWAKCEFELGNLNAAYEANTKAIALGGGHALRGFQEEVKHAMGRARLGLKPITEAVSKGQVVAAPPALGKGEVVAAPPALSKAEGPPIAIGKVVAAPPALKAPQGPGKGEGPAIGKVVSAPPPLKPAGAAKGPGAKTTQMVVPPPPKKTTQVAAPPPKAPMPKPPIAKPPTARMPMKKRGAKRGSDMDDM